MGAIEENVTRQRTMIALDSVVDGDMLVWSDPIDTGDYSGVYFSTLTRYLIQGGIRMRIQHSDFYTVPGDFADVDKNNLVYGRKDGVLPWISTFTLTGSLLPREGIVGNKRYIRVGYQGTGDTYCFVACMVTFVSNRFPLASDAVYSSPF